MPPQLVFTLGQLCYGWRILRFKSKSVFDYFVHYFVHSDVVIGLDGARYVMVKGLLYCQPTQQTLPEAQRTQKLTP